ncbi:MAG: hypothetical protein GY928_01690 [Colwellia sp.]|nr:hypothetical protein [Colwellia sp.]
MIEEAIFWREAYDQKTTEFDELNRISQSPRGYKRSCYKKKRNHEFYKRKANWKDRDNELYTFYEEEVEIDDKTHREWNRIIYKDLTNLDTKCWTGFTKLQLIHQAKEVCLPPEDIFLFRVRIYRYYTYQEMEMMFGYSKTSLRINFIKTLNIMFEKYAKPRLLNPKMSEPGISRSIINDKHTPQFVKLVRGMDEQDERMGEARTIVVNQDSTYQYCQYIKTNHKLFKAMKSAHKKVPLLKIHIWSCTDGRPIWAVVCYSDWDHADGDIFSCCFNKQHLDACYADLHAFPDSTREETLKRHAKLNLAFHDLETCKEMETLQQLMHDPADNLISDNGYKTRDGRLRMPLEPPQSDDGRLTVAGASWRRSITLIRQTCERMHRWCKRNRFCNSRINAADIQYVSKVWNIVMADIKFLDVKLMKDSESTSKFVRLLLALRYVMTAPVEKFYIPSSAMKKLSAPKRAKLVSAKKRLAAEKREMDDIIQTEAANRLFRTSNTNSNYSNHTQSSMNASTQSSTNAHTQSSMNAPPPMEMVSDDPDLDVDMKQNHIEESDCAEQETEQDEFVSLKHITSYGDTFTLCALGFEKVINYLKCIMKRQCMQNTFYEYEITQKDVEQYIGKKYANKLSLEYIGKLDTEYSDFALYKCKTNKYVYLFRNLTSRYKVSNTYDIIISFAEIAYYNKAKILIELQNIKQNKHAIAKFEEYAQNSGLKLPLTRPTDSEEKTLPNYYYDLLVDKLDLHLNEHENHWLQWLTNGGRKNSAPPKPRIEIKNGKEEWDSDEEESVLDDEKEHLVSQYLSEHNKDILRQLTQRRILALKSKKDYRWGGYIIGKMHKPRLIMFALDHGLEWNSIQKLKVAELKKYIYDHLLKTDPLATAQYHKHVLDEDDEAYQQMLAYEEKADDDDENNHHLTYIDYNYEFQNGSAPSVPPSQAQQRPQPPRLPPAPRQPGTDYDDKNLDLTTLKKVKDFATFAQRHKIFDESLPDGKTSFKYTDWTAEKFFEFIDQNEWCNITRPRETYKSTRKKSMVFKEIVRRWQTKWQADNVQVLSPIIQDTDQEQQQNAELRAQEMHIGDLPPQSTRRLFIQLGLVDEEDENDEDDEHYSDYDIFGNKGDEDEDVIIDNFDLERFWYDIDFDLWFSPLARLGVTCSCRSGAQLPSCCAHSSAVLWLIWFACYNNIDNAFKLSKRDQKILNTTESGIYNFHTFKAWIRKDILMYGGIARFCHCKNVEPKNEIEKFCEGCQYYYHPSCCGVQNGKYLFRCKSCQIWQVYTFRYAMSALQTKQKKGKLE